MITGVEENCCVRVEELIAVHDYKNNDKDSQRVYKLNEIAMASTDYIPPVPPRPSWFWYDGSILDFEVDEWRNSLATDRNKFTGYDKIRP